MERAALGWCAVDPNLPPVGFDQVAGNCQAQACAAAGARAVGLVKALEDARQVSRCNANAGILYLEADKLPF